VLCCTVTCVAKGWVLDVSRRSAFIPELPCEELVRRIIGEGWRNLPAEEIDGAWGVAIVRSILDGVGCNEEHSWQLKRIAGHLGVDPENLKDAFMRLGMNGVFRNDKIKKDRKALNGLDTLAWCYYAGLAQGATGNVTYRPSRRKFKQEDRKN